jgi:phosphopantothenoylcysteine decarboxylase/phosphopantothenate--cysteine ligase
MSAFTSDRSVMSLGNRSTGRMGVAIAEAALDRGARVTVVAGSVSVHLPAEATVIRVETTGQLRAVVLDALSREPGTAALDVLVMAAAVADFRPARPAEQKLSRGEALTLELVPTPDILAEVGRIVRGLDAAGDPTREPLRPPPVLVGFAAETGSLDRAADKLRRKHVDILVANDVAEPGSGFGTETNRVTILDRDGTVDELPLLTKREVADHLLDRVARRLLERDAAAPAAGPPTSPPSPTPETTHR